MFVSVDGKAKKVTEIYAGGQDGKAHRITELFGSVEGIAKQLFSVEKEEGVFDQFTWADIKQLANEGKLLEHFTVGDTVVVKLKEALRSEMTLPVKGGDGYIKVPQVQNEMMFQIVELTETKMRLMSPRVNALGTASSDIPRNSSDAGFNKDIWGEFVDDFQESVNSTACAYIDKAWGMTPMYTALKTIQNALPDDLVEVLSVCTKPLIEYSRHSITNALQTIFDTDMRVRQISTNEISKSVDTSGDIIYPIISKSYYPTSVNEYLYHIRIPEKYDNYEQRRHMVKNKFRGFSFMDQTKTTVSGSRYVKQSYSYAPYVTCYFTKGITTNAEYNEYMDNGGKVNDYAGKGVYKDTIFPEMIIEADAE